MNNTFWIPNEKQDKKAKQYLERINHAPYPRIVLLLLSLLIIFSGFILIGSF